ncbi:MAG: PqqD family protein [Acidobacteria bacterium]|nr:PqqD family protein [Acidobacteriota bacterium]
MYRTSNHLRTTYQQDGAIVLDIHRGQIFGLNHVGSKMLELLEAGRDESSIVLEISHEYEIDEGTVRNDLHEFIESLIQQRLLEPVPNRLLTTNDSVQQWQDSRCPHAPEQK